MSLKSALARSKLFANPDQLAIFPHLDPAQLSGDEAFHLLRLVGDAQLKDTVSPLKFSVAVETINALDRGNRIGNLINTPVSPTKTTGSCGKGKAKAALSPAAFADHSLASSKPITEGVETADGASDTDTTEGNTGTADGNTEAADGDTVTNDRASSAVPGTAMDTGKGTDDDSASIAEQDRSDDKEPSTSIPGESDYYF